jgi:hypothetical protein
MLATFAFGSGSTSATNTVTMAIGSRGHWSIGVLPPHWHLLCDLNYPTRKIHHFYHVSVLRRRLVMDTSTL